LTEPHLSAGATLVATAAGAGFTLAAEKAALAFFGIPLAAVTAALTGALVPLLFTEERLLTALRHWLGSALFALLLTALVLLLADLGDKAAIGVAAVLAMFARDLFAAARGELPPLVTAVRERLASAVKREGK
jgi:hypothetical protein